MTTYHLYEGTRESRDESDRGLSLRTAIKAAKYAVQSAKDSNFPNYVAHVINSKTGEFVHTEEFNFYV